MTNSREKFEAFYSRARSVDSIEGWTVQKVVDYSIWLAGRESMRDEAAEACKNEHLEDPQDGHDDAYDNGVFDCTSAVRKIQP